MKRQNPSFSREKLGGSLSLPHPEKPGAGTANEDPLFDLRSSIRAFRVGEYLNREV